MLSTAEIAAHLERLSYKDGWTFELREDPFEGPKIRIVAEGLPDSYKPGETIDLGVNSFLPPFVDTFELERWLFARLKRIEIHEAMEFFKRDGKVLYNPHAPA